MNSRYINEKDVYTLVEPHGLARVHVTQIDDLPRADVVPRRLYEELLKPPEPFPSESEIAARVLDEVEALLNTCRMSLIVGYDKVTVDHKLAALRVKYAKGGEPNA